MFGINKRKLNKLKDAIRRNDADETANIAGGLKTFRKACYFEACLLAAQEGANRPLEVLLAKHGFDFYSGPNGYDDQGFARKLIKGALSSSNTVPVLSALYATNEVTACGSLPIKDFINKDIPLEFIQAEAAKDSKILAACIEATQHSAENLNVILNAAPKTEDAQITLNNALVDAAGAGNIEAVKLFLEHHANPDASGGKPLLSAGASGNQEMVDLLLPLVDPYFCESIVRRLRQRDNPPSKSITASIEWAAAQSPASAPESQGGDDGFTAVNKDVLQQVLTLPDGDRLKYEFNFRAGVVTVLHDRGPEAASGVHVEKLDSFNPDFIKELRETLADLTRKNTPRVPFTHPQVRI